MDTVHSQSILMKVGLFKSMRAHISQCRV
jgi:hypothetical protein